MSSREFVGMVADDSLGEIELKSFHCKISNDRNTLKKERTNYKNIPAISNIENEVIRKTYLQIKKEVNDIIYAEMERIINDPDTANLIVKME
ncbi:MAG: hypothetical protein JST75_09600 [Bacteroidetes bacterium]|nr:hypothetical protein [Bacteroidota bacterium]